MQTEVDFVCNLGSSRIYLQSALNLATQEKVRLESRPLKHIADSFEKIIVVGDRHRAWRTDDGILVVGVVDSLLEWEWLRFLRPL
ncbi:MAG: hypothetical protein IJ228_02045 [Succinivibrio sp.]|nr:hypothetical protein [Succinivibrio sp.]